MFEKIVQRLLSKILGQYVEDFNSDNLKIGLWSGEVVLKDVKIKKQIMKKYNLPFKLRYSNLRCLKMNIPWSSLASSKIQVLIQGLEVLVSQVHPSQWQLKNQKIIQLRKQQIKAFSQSIINDFAQKAQQQNNKNKQDEGYFSNLVVKIIDNLQVTIKDIHIRYEDQITNEYSFGVTLQELKIYTVNQNDQPVFIDRTKKQFKNEPLRKKLILSNFGIYWNQKTTFFKQQTMGDNLKNTIARKTNPQANSMNYIFLMSFQAHLLQRQKGQQFKDPQVDLFLDFDQLKVQISNQQLQQIVNMGQRLQNFSTEVKRKNKVKLSEQQTQANRAFFKRIYPKLYKNQNIGGPDMEKLEDILQKMQVQAFKPIMKDYLQQKQRQRILKQKRDKSRGWFSGPKQVTQDEKKQIQKFLQNNFGKQPKSVIRPKEFFHTRINLCIKVVEIVIVNSQKNIRQGIRTQFINIGTQFNLRENGYLLQFGISDVQIDIFNKKKDQPQKVQQFLKKLNLQSDKGEGNEYVRMIVEGSPINRTYADTYIKLVTQQLLIMFDPKLINIATNFANIKINPQNTSAAIQKYGQIKQKTAKSVNQTLQSKKKSFIQINIKLKAITAVLYLDPQKKNQDIWVVTLGETKIRTDKKTLQQTQVKPYEPTQKYKMSMNKISFRYFQNYDFYLETRLHQNNQSVKRLEDIVTNLNIDVTLQMFKQSTKQIPKIKALLEMSQFKANITAFTYQKVQKIGNCFVDKQAIQRNIQQKSDQKTQIINKTKKIGFIYIQDSTMTKEWSKYIGVLADNYLYLYKDKKDLDYVHYYYIRNSDITMLENQDQSGKLFCFQVKNKVNTQIFGVQKANAMNQWMKIIDSVKDIDQYGNRLYNTSSKDQKAQNKQLSAVTPPQNDPNLLNFVLGINMQTIHIITHLTVHQQKNNIVEIKFKKLDLDLYLHEKKKIIKLSLESLDLSDNILFYKMKKLQKFLSTQTGSEKDKLIDIKVQLIDQSHPQYQYTDTTVNVSFGRLICNYKAQTVQQIMKFFIPPPSQGTKTQAIQQTKKQIASKASLGSKQSINPENKQKIQRFSLKVHLKMSQISVNLINTKTKVFFAEMSMQDFQMMFGMSDMRMAITGGIQQLSLKDYSNYPQTIIQEQEKYQTFKYIMTSQRKNKQQQNSQGKKHLIFFDVNMLNKQNKNGKKMLIQAQIFQLQVSYIQQPVLRLITYLNTQMLPSFNPPQQNNIGKTQLKKQQELKKKKQLEEQAKASQTKPKQNTMSLQVKIQKISVLIEPRNQNKQQLKLSIDLITVKNSSLYRDFLKGTQDQVLVQNYEIGITDMKMFVSYPHPKTGIRQNYKLTPDIDLNLSVDLIQNSLYYQTTYGNKFMDGMRLKVWMSDFFMRINHQDYNFLMKCLYWNVTNDDNAQLYLFDIPQQPVQQKNRQIPPLYCYLRIQSVSLFVIQNQLPLAFVLLGGLDYKFVKSGTKSMNMGLIIQDMLGSSIVHKDNNVSIQKGMFNSFAYQQVLKTSQLKDIDNLLTHFQRKNLLTSKTGKKQSVVYFEMGNDQKSNSWMIIEIQKLTITVQMQTLLTLSQLALMQQYIQPPKSKLQPLLSQQQKAKKKQAQQQAKQNKKPSTGKSQMKIQLKNFLASLTDTQKRNFFIMDGQIIGKMITYPTQTDEKIVKLSRRSHQDRFLDNSYNKFELKNFSIYFCNIQNMKNKRYILKPFSIQVVMDKYYQLKRKHDQAQLKPKQMIRQQTHSNQQQESIKNQESKLSLLKRPFLKQSQKKDKQQQPINKKAQENIQKLLSTDVILLVNQINTQIGTLLFVASIRDLLKINQIIQDNLSNMNKYNEQNKKMQQKIQEKTEQVKSKIDSKIQQAEKQRKQQQEFIQKAKTQMKRPILQKTKVKVILKPIELLIINDCDQNFMPVIKFIIQETMPIFQLDLLQSHLNLILIISLSFFNPRSSKWEPVIQTFSANFDYLNVIAQKKSKTYMYLTNSKVQELKQLKINISTQFLASLMSTLQKSKEQQKNIKNQLEQKIKQQGGQQVQISPFIIQNITNKIVTIKRKFQNIQSDFSLKPMFRGTVRLMENAQNLQFTVGENPTIFKVSLQHYGVLNINNTTFYIQFKVDKINRLIRFFSDTVLQNQLSHIIYVKRYFRNGRVDDIDFAMQKKQMLALDGVKSIQISLNKRSYSQKADISLIKSLNQSAALKALNEKFLLWITKKAYPNKFTKLEVWPPLLIYNCLPKQFTIQFIVNDKVNTKQIPAQTAHQVNANIDFYQLKYKINLPGFYWSPDFQMRDNILNQQMGLELRDRQNGITTINYIFSKAARGYTLIFYCKAFLISQLQDDILAYGNLASDEAQKKTEQYFVLGGQRVKSPLHDDDVVIIGSEYGSNLRICGDGCMIDFSQPFSLGGIGMTQNRRIVIKRQFKGQQIDIFTTIGVDVSIKQMFKNLQIFSKMVTIHCRAVIINSTDKVFRLRQQGSTRSIFKLEKGEKKNLYFTMPQNPKKARGMIFSTQESTSSPPINISQLGTLYFKVMNKVIQTQQYYKIHIQQVSKYIFYQITQLTEQQIPYQVQNLMPKSKVLLKFNNVTLSQGQKFSFIKQTWQEQHVVRLKISHQNSQQTKQIIVYPDDLNFLHRQPFDLDISGMKGTIHAQIKIRLQDKKKIIVVDQVAHSLGYIEKEEKYMISLMSIKLQKISFSFIQNHISIDKPFQSFGLFLQGLQLIDQQFNLDSQYQIRLNYIQFDQQQPFNMPNPVIITPYKMKQFLREQKPKYIFNTHIIKNKKFTKNTFFDSITIKFDDLVVKVSQYFIDLVMRMTKQFTQVINYKEEDYLVKRKVDKWSQVVVPKQGAKTFIKHIKIAQFVLQISAEIKLDQLDKQSFLFFGTILNALGVVITNIQGAPITLDGIQLRDCVDTLSGINQKLINHYKNSVIKQLYKIFGSLNIIGNPIGLFRNISTGIKDLKDKPSDGFVEGPLQFGKGIAQGTSSLIAHSIGGALGSISKVTGTISTGLAVLAFDKQFQELRQKQKMQKPQHVFQGIQKGGKAVFYGFRQGIKGVFTQPYQNARKQGIVGLFKGTAKGLAGLVVKPVTGVIDFASKTTQGLKNTALYLQDKPNENRMRNPRVFYTQCCTVKQYDQIDSKLNAIINKLKYQSEYQQSYFIQSFQCDDQRFLLILQEKVMMIKYLQQKIDWAINMSQIRIAKNDRQRKQLLVKDIVEHTFRKSDHIIKISQDSIRDKICNIIHIMQTQYNK